MNSKKEKAEKQETVAVESAGISTAGELKSFLVSVRDKMVDRSAPPIYGLTALNYVLNLETVYTLLNDENKQLCREIWLRLKKAGFQLKNPPMLFGPEEDGLTTAL
jgi:DNA polymerase IIIc chi subunit